MELSYIAGALFLASGLPQTIKLLKTKKSDDISVWMYLLTGTGIIFILIDARGGVFFSNLVSLILLTVNLGLIVKYKKGIKD